MRLVFWVKTFWVPALSSRRISVCGEETALLNSMEGKRGMPRPPFPAVKGLWDEPTIVNNVDLVEIPMGTTLRELIYDIGGGAIVMDEDN